MTWLESKHKDPKSNPKNHKYSPECELNYCTIKPTMAWIEMRIMFERLTGTTKQKIKFLDKFFKEEPAWWRKKEEK